jgi:hypothetical protein
MSTSPTEYSRTGILPFDVSVLAMLVSVPHGFIGLSGGCGTVSGQAVIDQLDELIDVSTGDAHGAKFR